MLQQLMAEVCRTSRESLDKTDALGFYLKDRTGEVCTLYSYYLFVILFLNIGYIMNFSANKNTGVWCYFSSCTSRTDLRANLNQV